MLSGTRMSASRVKEQLFESKDEAKQAFKKAKASTSGSMKNNDKAFGKDPETQEIVEGPRKLVLVLDGFDEAGEKRRAIVDWLVLWLKKHMYRCPFLMLTSRPTGTHQVLAADGQARDPMSTSVVAQIGPQIFLTEELLPACANVALFDQDDAYLSSNTVASTMEAFYLWGEGVDRLQEGVHVAEIGQDSGPKMAQGTIPYDKRHLLRKDSVGHPLGEAFRDWKQKGTETVQIFVLGFGLQRFHAVRKRISDIPWAELEEWPKDAFPARIVAVANLFHEEYRSSKPTTAVSLLKGYDGQAFIYGERRLLPEGAIGNISLEGKTFHLLPLHCYTVVKLSTAHAGNSPVKKIADMSLHAELRYRLGFSSFSILELSVQSASRISGVPAEALQTLAPSVRSTPLMASILGKFCKDNTDKEHVASEKSILHYALQQLLQQAEGRTGAASGTLRGPLAKVCFQNLKASTRLISRLQLQASPREEVLFEEAHLGNVLLFEPARDEIQLYHLRFHELLAAEASPLPSHLSQPTADLLGPFMVQPEVRSKKMTYVEAFQLAQTNAMLRGALRFLVMLLSEGQKAFELDLKGFASGAADVLGVLPGALLMDEALTLNLSCNKLGCDGIGLIANTLREANHLINLDVELCESALGADKAQDKAFTVSKALASQALALNLGSNALGRDLGDVCWMLAGERGVQRLAAALGSLTQLRTLKLELPGNRLGRAQKVQRPWRLHGRRQSLSRWASLGFTGHLTLDLGFNQLGRVTSDTQSSVQFAWLNRMFSAKSAGVEQLVPFLQNFPELKELKLVLLSNRLGLRLRNPEDGDEKVGHQDLDLNVETNQMGCPGIRELIAISGQAGAALVSAALRKLPRLRRLALKLQQNQLRLEPREPRLFRRQLLR
ncbi:unnamed protein product [Symbiodinium natans]|uniref:NACHT domain-containing protein n=1 Tax=Symbiodinium natans TaxID=878477 RepID=A0A812MR88_9DINO|nr:unnamed protein product [Symbiodinium natans]